MLSRCKFCQKTIEWIEVDGKKIPLDPRVPTYQWDDTPLTPALHSWKKSSASVDHREVCEWME